MSISELSIFFKAIADPIRLTVLQLLGQGAFAVLELSELLGVRQSGMSHHLKVLHKAGWVESRREGNSIYYRRSLTNQNLQPEILHTLDSHALPAELILRLADIHQARLQAAQQFFAQHANELSIHQERMVLFEQYNPETLALMDHYRRVQHRSVLEVGPGRGDLLKALHQRFDAVTGIDISTAMLDQANAQLSEAHNIVLLHGDTRQLVKGHQRFDVVVYNMVLHHVPEPSQEIARCGQLLSSHGLLVITDLCRHDQTWAYKECGDHWLGFEPSELHQFAESAGLTHLQSRFMAVRNGFQVQTQLYCKKEPLKTSTKMASQGKN